MDDKWKNDGLDDWSVKKFVISAKEISIVIPEVKVALRDKLKCSELL